MNTWFIREENQLSFYIYPITWNKLLSLFDGNDECKVDHFVGWKDGQTLYKSWHGCSPELLQMQSAMSLYELKTHVKQNTKWQHEYEIKIGSVYIERSITGGIIFTSDPATISVLTKKLNISGKYFEPMYESKLISVGKNGTVKLISEFDNREALLDYIYLMLMKKVDPGYEKFMSALNSAVLEK